MIKLTEATIADLSTEPVISQDTQIIIVSPDGTITFYNSDGDVDTSTSELAHNLWAAQYGALDKPFNLYSVSESLLLVIAAAAVVFIFSKIFKRRKL